MVQPLPLCGGPLYAQNQCIRALHLKHGAATAQTLFRSVLANFVQAAARPSNTVTLTQSMHTDLYEDLNCYAVGFTLLLHEMLGSG